MTSIDLTAAIKAADEALSSDRGDEFCQWDREAEIALTAALPHILATVEARVKPTREDVARTLDNELGPFLSYNPERFWGQPADAVLALLPGRTETEVREEIAAEVSESRLRHLAHLRPHEVIENLARDIARGGERS